MRLKGVENFNAIHAVIFNDVIDNKGNDIASNVFFFQNNVHILKLILLTFRCEFQTKS